MAALEVAGHLSATELGRRYWAARGRVEPGHLQVAWLLVQCPPSPASPAPVQ
jgi:hypothetical protein